MSTTTDIKSGIDTIENRREELERAANSDLPVAPVAEALLEALDE